MLKQQVTGNIMKIKGGRLQQIIQEELGRVLEKEVDNDLDTDNDGKISVGELQDELEDITDDLYVVIGNAGRGRQNMLPSSGDPGVYSKEEAERLASERNKRGRHSPTQIHYHAKPLFKAAEFISGNQMARTGLGKLLSKYGAE